MATIPESSVRPTTIVNADSRFGTTFLSTKYRDRAVNGEVLMDKTSGEIFIKRVSDGKIVSFYQNKKMINDLALDLRILLLGNPALVYPSKNENAFYIVTNYDLVAINNETLYNIMVDDIIIPGEPNDINKLTFKVSGGSTGFVCRNTTRDVDKVFVEFLTNQYNAIIKNYSGDNEIYLAEYEKIQNIDKWENCNAVLTYDIIVSKDGEDHSYLNNIDYIRLNDDSVVLFPEKIYTDLESFDSAIITIKSITYDKLQFMITHKDDFGVLFNDTYNKIISHDNRVEVSEFIINHFIDDAYDIQILGNENIIGFLNIGHFNRYMYQVEQLVEGTHIQISPVQPSFACTWFKPNNTI